MLECRRPPQTEEKKMVLFEESAHAYKVDGISLPSVTEICRFLSYDQAAGAKPWLRDEAANRGSRVHAWCAVYDYEGETPETEPDVQPYLEAYVGFLRDYNPAWDLIEHPMGSERLGFAGTLDRYGMIDGKPCLLDIKTGSRMHKAPLSAQLAGYALLLQEEGRPLEKGYGLHLDKRGCYDLVEIIPDEALFSCCMQIDKKLRRKHA